MECNGKPSQAQFHARPAHAIVVVNHTFATSVGHLGAFDIASYVAICSTSCVHLLIN